MNLFLCLVYTLATASCFILMPETCRKGGWVRRFKFVYLWALLLLPLAHLLAADYLCQLLRFLAILGSFVVLCHVSYQKISKAKKFCVCCLYMGLFVQLLTLLTTQISSLLP